MSQFSRIRTQMVEKEYLKRALADLGYAIVEGATEVRDWGGRRSRVEIVITTRHPGYEIGFAKYGDAYECVADWYGIREINQQSLIEQLTQRYAYHATLAHLEEQGFALVNEEMQQDGGIHLVLRRMA